MIKKEISLEDLNQKIKNFVNENSSNYSQYERNFILNNYGWGMGANFVPDLLQQIYDELNLIDDDKNIYNGFIKILENNFDLDQDIIEVGGGRIISGIAKRIALKQKKGTVTVYDPILFQKKTDIPNLILKKESFTVDTDIKGAKLIYGFMPCVATEPIIYKAGSSKTDFLIALCDGHDERFYDDIYSDYGWHDEIAYIAGKCIRENDLGILRVTDLKDYDDPYPVIYNKRSNVCKQKCYRK